MYIVCLSGRPCRCGLARTAKCDDALVAEDGTACVLPPSRLMQPCFRTVLDRGAEACARLASAATINIPCIEHIYTYSQSCSNDNTHIHTHTVDTGTATYTDTDTDTGTDTDTYTDTATDTGTDTDTYTDNSSCI